VVIVSVTFASTCEWPEEVVASTELKNASARASTEAPTLYVPGASVPVAEFVPALTLKTGPLGPFRRTPANAEVLLFPVEEAEPEIVYVDATLTVNDTRPPIDCSPLASTWAPGPPVAADAVPLAVAVMLAPADVVLDVVEALAVADALALHCCGGLTPQSPLACASAGVSDAPALQPGFVGWLELC
jgi:hypothetical protein